MRVKILKPHRHRGEDLEVGDTVDLPSRAAKFAIRAKSARKIAARSKPDAESDSPDPPADESDS